MNQCRIDTFTDAQGTAEWFVRSLEASTRGRKLHIKVTSKRDGQVDRYTHSLCIVGRDPVHLLERRPRKAGTGMPTLLCKSNDRVPILRRIG